MSLPQWTEQSSKQKLAAFFKLLALPNLYFRMPQSEPATRFRDFTNTRETEVY
jgi:hypothetical protein